MQRNTSGMVVVKASLVVIGIAMVSTMGCGSRTPPSPGMTGTPKQIDQTLRQDAQNYAAYRISHSGGAGQAGQPGTGQ